MMAWPKDIEKCRKLLGKELEDVAENAGNLPFGLECFDRVTGLPSPRAAKYKKDLFYHYWRLLELELGEENVQKYVLSTKGHILIFVCLKVGGVRGKNYKVLDKEQLVGVKI
jgi:hypothetical protein